MPKSWFDRLRNGWNAFRDNKNPTKWPNEYGSLGYNSFAPRPMIGADKTILNAILNRIAVDVAAVTIRHCRVDADERFVEDIDDGLSDCLRWEANIDQTGRELIENAVLTMLMEGHACIVPTDFNRDPSDSDAWDTWTLRVGTVVSWYNEVVQVDLYNEQKGQHEEITLPKRLCAIIQNPFYVTMNGPNGTLSRLVKMLSAMETVNEKLGSKKLDMIIQLPYKVRSEALMQQAEQRVQSITTQLEKNPLGIAYTDATDKVIQLNRSLENNLQASIDATTTQLYGQLGVTREVMEGTANEEQMLLYNNRTIEPIISALCGEMTRKFLSRNARGRGERVKFFVDPFRLVAMNQIADIADKFTRNEVLSPNEVRTILGMKPANDPAADELRNRNISTPVDAQMGPLAPDGTGAVDGSVPPMEGLSPV